MSVSGVVFAGGLSSRMGEDKALLKFNGKTLLQNAVDLLRPVTDSMLISTAQEKMYDIADAEIITDNVKAVGPLGGLLSVLSSNYAEAYFILPCDLPLMTSDIIQQILQHWLMDPSVSVVARSNRGIEPLIGIYSVNILETVRQCIAGRKYAIQDLLIGIEYKTVEVVYNDQLFDPFWNVNYQKEYQKILNDTDKLVIE